MDIMKALRELLSRAEAETETVPNDGMTADEADTETMPPAIDSTDEADQGAEAGNGDSTADQAADDTEAETLPGSEVSESELRDAPQHPWRGKRSTPHPHCRTRRRRRTRRQ